MKTTTQAIRMVVLISLLVGMSTLWTGEGRAQGPILPKYNVEFIATGSELLPQSARDAIVKSLDMWKEMPPENNTFYFIGLRWEDTWAIGTITSANLNSPVPDGQESHLNLSNLVSVILVKTEKGWEAAIDVDRYQVYELLKYVPESELDQSARQALFPPVTQLRNKQRSTRQQYQGYKLPWAPNQNWALTQWWHGKWDGIFPDNSALDLAPSPPQASEILSAAAGSVTYICSTANSFDAFVVVTTNGTSEKVGYLHLQKSLKVSQGASVVQGAPIGNLVEGNQSCSTNCCGYGSSGAHLHMYLPSKPFTMDGVTFTQDNKVLYNGQNYTTYYLPASSQGISTPTPPTTVATLSGTPGNGYWYRSNVSVNLTTTDNGGGAKNTQYKIDNGAWQTGTSFTVSGDGNHTVYYKSQDNAGNWEADKSTTFGIDTVAPTGSLVINNNSAATYATLVTLALSATDGSSGLSQMHFRDSGGVWSSYQSYSSSAMWQLASAVNGQNYTVEVQFKDVAGNESVVASDSITLNLYPARPVSANYSLLKSTFGTVGQQSNQSASYVLHGTLGQPSMVSQVSSTNYKLGQGYWGSTTSTTPTPTPTPIPNSCNVPISPNFTLPHGMVTLNSQAAAIGTLIEAINPRGQVVGCFTVSTSGLYGTMQIYGEDTSVTPNVPGMRAGETVIFRVAGQTATASPTLVWQNDRATQVINLTAPALNTQQTIVLQPGWNLISFNVEPTNPAVAQVLNGLNYSRVLAESTTYVPSLPASFNTLKELHAKQAYYLYYSGSSSTNLVIQGTAVAANTPITLKAGWNWLGYLPSTTLPINTALTSITGQYQRVLGSTGSYIPSLPATFSTLKELTPGQGYLIYMNNAATLTYPNSGGGRGVVASALTACPAIAMTPYVSLVYGQLQVNGQPAPLGSRVQAINQAGHVVGCVEVTTTGQFGLMPLYGATETEKATLSFQVNGVPADTSFTWQNDREAHVLDLSITIKQQYLPLIVK